ncbi:MAG: hypothetical protein PHI35_02230 [Victivallaceae bacterium]|nr:hypothetical protein [Victivallaceae bacterium]
MIVDAPYLTTSQKSRSQLNYYAFSAVNGLSYMCLGETVLILFAVQLACPDYVVATLGAMMYFGFLLLPLGKYFTARHGAVASQAVFWMLRNIAALMVASAALVYAAGFPATAAGLVVTGAFFFYGFRAAGVIMSQPLLGEITDEDSRARMLAINNGIFYAACFIALIIIKNVLAAASGVAILAAVIITGSALGFTSTIFIRRICETGAIRQSASKPLAKELKTALASSSMRRQMAAGFAFNLAIIMMIPPSMMALKRGLAVSDTAALGFALVQFASSAVISVVCGKISELIGPRRVILGSYWAIVAGIGIVWLIMPTPLAPFAAAAPFWLAGGAAVAGANATTHYFLQNVQPERRVAMSIFVAVVAGVGAGLTGIILAGLLLKWLTDGVPETELMTRYRCYFFAAMLLLAPGAWLIKRLEPLPIEKRKIKRSWDTVLFK